MTAILVVVQEGRAWVGADSRASGHAFRDDAEKVFIEGGWLWGVAGHSAQACWLRAKLPRQAPDASDEAYLLDVGAQLQVWLRARCDVAEPEDRRRGAVALIAARGPRAWLVTGEGIERIGELAALGDPTAPAAAYLCTDGGLSVPDRIRLAIEATARVSAYVGGAVCVLEAPPVEAGWPTR